MFGIADGRSPRPVLLVLALLAAVLAVLPAAAAGAPGSVDPSLQGDKGKPGLPDLDARHGKRAPTAAQQAATHGASVRWNQFGTPATLIDYGGYLATGLAGDPVAAARHGVPAHTGPPPPP